MQLFFKEEVLGHIYNVKVEGMWFSGEIHPSEVLERFREFLDAMIDEQHEFDGEKYDSGWLDVSNWYVIDDQCCQKGIDLPAIYPEGEIHWRYI